jgi:hypothetical protein
MDLFIATNKRGDNRFVYSIIADLFRGDSGYDQKT